MNLSSMVYPDLSTPIDKSFLVSILLFCSLPIKSLCHKFFELSLRTTITVLMPVSWDPATSFNYDDRKARDVGLIWWCHPSDSIADSIFHESMRQEITFSVLFCLLFVFVCCLLFPAGWYFCLPQFYHYNISGCGEILNYNGLRQMGLISLQWDFKSETCQGISD